MDPGPIALSSSIDLGRMLQSLVRYLDRASNNVMAFRIKTKFVIMVESFLARPEWLPARKDNFLRNVLLSFFTGWTSDSIPVRKDLHFLLALNSELLLLRQYQAIHDQQNHDLIHSLDLACLRCIVELTSKLKLQPVDNIVSPLDTVHVRARLFQRHLGFFIAVIERLLRSRNLKPVSLTLSSRGLNYAHSLHLLARGRSIHCESILWNCAVNVLVFQVLTRSN